MEPWLEPLYDATGMRAVDAWAIEERRVASLDLMEAAGLALANAVQESAPEGPVHVVCGKGNNGGDGLVAARYLREWGFECEVFLLWPGAELKGDAAANFERLGFEAKETGPEDVAAALAGSAAVVDAILGTGFEGAPRSPVREAIDAINECGAHVVAADIASGIDASTGETEGTAVGADVTVTFHAAKLGHLIAPGKSRTGELRVVPIGIPEGDEVEPAGGAIGIGALADLPRRGSESTKFTSGQVVVAGGSRGLTGAPCLVASAAIRAGAGYATALVPAGLEPIVEAKLTEVMTRGCADADGAFTKAAADEILEAAKGAGALVLGPGLGKTKGALSAARAAAAGAAATLVLDADGLNAHAGALTRLASRGEPTILTPHAGELARLLERESSDVAAKRLASAYEAATAANAIVVLKGDDSIVVDGRGGRPVAVNMLSSPALATAGTGDVLAGTIGALVARGVEPFHAACAAVVANARAGLIAAERVGSAESVIAGDVIEALPRGLIA